MRLNTPLVFFLFSVLYFFVMPIELIIRDTDNLLNGTNTLWITNVVQLSIDNRSVLYQIVLVSILAVISFIVGFKLSGFSRMFESCIYTYPEYRSILAKQFLTFLLFLLAITWLIGIIFFYDDLRNSIGSYSTNFTFVFEHTGYAVYQMILYGVMVICGVLFSSTKSLRFFGVLLLFILLFMGFLVEDKDPMVLAILALFANSFIYRKRITIVGVSLLISGLIFLLYLASVYAHVRGGEIPYLAFYKAFIGFSLLHGDMSGPFVSTWYMFTNDIDYMYGLSYFRDIQILLPKFIYTSRPDTIPVEFAKTLLKNDYLPGMGVGYSPLAEAILNFSIYGAFFHFFILGFVWGAFWRLIFKFIMFFNCLSLFGCILLYRSFGFYFILLMFRSTSLSFIKSSLMYLASLFIILIVYRICVFLSSFSFSRVDYRVN